MIAVWQNSHDAVIIGVLNQFDNMKLEGGAWQRQLDAAVDAAIKAGGVIKQGFNKKKAGLMAAVTVTSSAAWCVLYIFTCTHAARHAPQVVDEKKNSSDLVTETDVAVGADDPLLLDCTSGMERVIN